MWRTLRSSSYSSSSSTPICTGGEQQRHNAQRTVCTRGEHATSQCYGEQPRIGALREGMWRRQCHEEQRKLALHNTDISTYLHQLLCRLLVATGPEGKLPARRS